MKSWKHLTFEQRKVISNGISHKYKLKEIAEALGYDPTSISKEVKRNREQITIGKNITDCNKINRWLTGIYGAGEIVNAGAQVMSNLGNNMGTITNGATDGITGALDGLVQGGKNLVNTVAGWFS